MKQVQAEIAAAEITGESGAGMVRITLNGKHEARRVVIDPEAMKEDKEFLEDLIAAAINDASQKLERHSAEKMSQGHRRPQPAAGHGVLRAFRIVIPAEAGIRSR